jgi:hypothetical protein
MNRAETVERPEVVQRAFFQQMVMRAARAEASVGSIEHVLDVAGVRVKLVFAGPRLESLFMGALSHLLTDETGAPDATFHVWDSESTGVEMLPPPCSGAAFTDRGDLSGFGSRRYRSAFHWSEYSVCVLDTESRVGVYWVERAANLPYWARSSPMRTLFHWLMELYGRQLVHAAAVGTDVGGALIVGKGGVGKSTTSLACLAAGLRFVGDDYVIVGFDPHPMAWSLYCTAKVSPEQLRAFPELEPLADPLEPQDEKAVIRLYPEQTDRFARALPLRWMLTPRFGNDAATQVEAISPVALHHAAAFTTLSQLPHAGSVTHQFIGRLVSALLRGRLVLGRDVQAVPQAIRRLITEGSDVQQFEHQAHPLVTVIVPVFNGAHFLKDAVASIVAQNYPALEIIIVDDGSADNIQAAVDALPVDVRFFRQMNAGPSAARNRGLRDASGDLIAFLDVDDQWTDGSLAALVTQMQAAPEADVVLGKAQMARVTANGTEPYQTGDLFPYYIGSALYRRRAFDRIGAFDETLRFGEDTDWFQRLTEAGAQLIRMDRTTLVVRRHGGNMTEGKSVVELGVIQTLKRALDRRRERQNG